MFNCINEYIKNANPYRSLPFKIILGTPVIGVIVGIQKAIFVSRERSERHGLSFRYLLDPFAVGAISDLALMALAYTVIAAALPVFAKACLCAGAVSFLSRVVLIQHCEKNYRVL